MAKLKAHSHDNFLPLFQRKDAEYWNLKLILHVVRICRNNYCWQALATTHFFPNWVRIQYFTNTLNFEVVFPFKNCWRISFQILGFIRTFSPTVWNESVCMYLRNMRNESWLLLGAHGLNLPKILYRDIILQTYVHPSIFTEYAE